MDVRCGPVTCPVLLDSACVFYEGDELVFIDLQTGNSVEKAIKQINSKMQTLVPQDRVLTINGVSYDLSADRTWTVFGGHVIQDEGVSLPNRTYLNFVGAGVTASDDSGNDATIITIPGGGSGTAAWGSIATGTGVASQTDLVTYLGANYYALSNPANYIDCAGVPACETDPIFNAWLAGPPNISIFTNDVPYLTSGTEFIQSITDTNSIDLSLIANSLSADLRYQNSSQINLSVDASGLKGVFASNNISQFTNDSGYLTTISGISAGGDLSGTYVNPTVAKIKGNTVPVNASGALTNDGAGNLSWTPDAGGTVTNIATSGPITGGPISTTGTIGITQSTTSTNGYLSSTDWNTFNNKQSALSFANLSGTSNQITLSASGTGVLVGSTNITLSIPSNAQLSIAKITNLVSNGFVKTSGGDGTLSIDTTSYLSTLTIGTTTISSGTTTRVLYDNAGVLGEYSVTGSAGNVVLSGTPTITTPNITTGFTIGGAASSGKFIVGDGTNFVPSTSTIPTSSGATANKHLKSDGTNYVLTTATISDTPSTALKWMRSDGTNWITSTSTLAEGGVTALKHLRSDGTNWIATTATISDSPSTAGKVLISDGTNWITSTSIFPNTVGGAGTILRSDGTVNAYTTATYPNTVTVNRLLYASASNVISDLATANSSLLVTDGSGVPSLSTTIPNGVTATTQAANDNSTKLATTAYADNAAATATTFWKLTGTSTLTGVATITSNAAVQRIFNGTWTASANNQYAENFGSTITSRSTASDAIIGTSFTHSLTANAATIDLKSVVIAPTFIVTGGISTLTAHSTSSPAGMTPQTTNASPASTSGSGTGSSINVTVTATTITVNSITTAGSGFNLGDTVTFNGSQFGGSGSVTFAVTVVTGNSLGTNAASLVIVNPLASSSGLTQRLIDFRDVSGTTEFSFNAFYPASGGGNTPQFRINSGSVNAITLTSSAVGFNLATIVTGTFSVSSTSSFSGAATFSATANTATVNNSASTNSSFNSTGTVGAFTSTNQIISQYKSSNTLGSSQVGLASALSAPSGGTGYTTGIKATTGGSGTGLTINITSVSGGVPTAISISARGTGYKNGETITISTGGANCTTIVTVDFSGSIIAPFYSSASYTDASSQNSYYFLYNNDTQNFTSSQTTTTAALYYNPTQTSAATNNYGIIIAPSAAKNGFGTTSPSANLHIVQGVFTSGWVPGFRVDAGAHTGLTTATEFIANDFRGATQTWVDGTVTTQRFNYHRAFTANKTTTSATFTDIYNAFFEKSIAGTGVTFTRNWGIGTDGNLQVQGKAYIGAATTSPTALLMLAAGTSTANTAPLKFTTGTSLTSAEAGAMEFTTDDLFFTITTGAARKNITLWDTLGTSGRMPYVTTNGRLIDDASLLYDTTNGIQTTKNLKLTTAGGAIYIKQGSNATCGRATLSGGTVTVNTTAVATADEIFLTDRGGTVTNLGTIYVSAVVAATSFTITSTNILDSSDVSWVIIKAA